MVKEYLDPTSITMAANAVSVAFAQQLSIDDQFILGSILTLAGADLLNMATINDINRRRFCPPSGTGENTAF